MLQADLVEQLPRPCGPLSARPQPDHGDLHVLGCCERRQEVVRLEDVADRRRPIVGRPGETAEALVADSD